jgi:hypothetical protein
VQRLQNQPQHHEQEQQSPAEPEMTPHERRDIGRILRSAMPARALRSRCPRCAILLPVLLASSAHAFESMTPTRGPQYPCPTPPDLLQSLRVFG